MSGLYQVAQELDKSETLTISKNDRFITVEVRKKVGDKHYSARFGVDIQDVEENICDLVLMAFDDVIKIVRKEHNNGST